MILDRYGSKRGLARHLYSLALDRFGALERYRAIDWARARRVVFVCKGNICRSPYAEARARLLGLEATSFGLSADGRSPAHPGAARAGLERGVDLSGHRSRARASVSIERSDLIFALEPEQAGALGDSVAQVSLLGLWASPPAPHIEDPYGLSDEYFRTCFDRIDSAIWAIKARLGAG